MILATLDDAERFTGLHPLFSDAFRWLRETDVTALADGRHEINGEELFAVVWEGFGKGQSEAVLECHREYIDIQSIVSGSDVIGWRPLDSCQRIKSPYDSENDLLFYFDQPTSWCRVPAGSLTVLYPEDVHAPLGGTSALKKVILKVKLA